MHVTEQMIQKNIFKSFFFFFFFFFSSAIWLSHTQLWTNIEGAASLTNVNHCISSILDAKITGTLKTRMDS